MQVTPRIAWFEQRATIAESMVENLGLNDKKATRKARAKKAADTA